MCKSYFLTIFVLWVVLKYQYFIAFCTKNLFFTDFIRFFKGHNSLKKTPILIKFFSKCPERAKQVFMFFDHIQFVNCWWEIYEKLKSWRPSWNFWRPFWIFFFGQHYFLNLWTIWNIYAKWHVGITIWSIFSLPKPTICIF